MNEHDSERIAGLLEADGLIAAPDAEHADVVVLNSCCIRENADNKLYGNLGVLKAVKDRRPGMQIVVSGCLAQNEAEGIRAKAPWVDVVFGTHNVHRAADLIELARREGPIVEVLEATAADDAAAFPSALPAKREQGHSAWVTIQIGCDNSCAFCIVPAVRGPEISRPVRCPRRRGRGPGRRRRHRGDVARAERELLRPRPHARSPTRRWHRGGASALR